MRKSRFLLETGIFSGYNLIDVQKCRGCELYLRSVAGALAVRALKCGRFFLELFAERRV